MHPTVSVVVRVYNAERHLREAVESVLAQTFADFELLAIDDGSNDASVAILESYGDPRIRIVSQPNGGKIAAAQRGLAEARGRYVAILDADDRSAPERFARQVAYLEAHPDVVMVGSALGIIDERGARVGAAAILGTTLRFGRRSRSTIPSGTRRSSTGATQRAAPADTIRASSSKIGISACA